VKLDLLKGRAVFGSYVRELHKNVIFPAAFLPHKNRFLDSDYFWINPSSMEGGGFKMTPPKFFCRYIFFLADISKIRLVWKKLQVFWTCSASFGCFRKKLGGGGMFHFLQFSVKKNIWVKFGQIWWQNFYSYNFFSKLVIKNPNGRKNDMGVPDMPSEF